MLRVAVFIDAGYLWKQLCKALFPGDEAYHRSNVNFNYAKFRIVLMEYVKTTFSGIPLLRCYWYDAPLANGNLSSDHNKIALLNDFKLRLGSRIIEAPDGRTRQKGVDGLIIADLIGLAQNRILSHALLISGDGDMVPGVGVAQALGVRIHLLAIHSDNATSPQLRMEADLFDVWQEEISKFAQGRIAPDDLRRVVAPAANSQCATLPLFASGSEEGGKPSSVSPAGSAPAYVIPQLTEFFDNLTGDEKNSVSQAQIPYDIDRRLLRFVLEHKGKALTEEEKRAARNALRECARGFRL